MNEAAAAIRNEMEMHQNISDVQQQRFESKEVIS
jgi:hypothetical protein